MDKPFEGRNHPLKEWNKIKTEVLDHYNSPTMVFVLVEFREYCLRKKIESIPTSLYWVHGVFFYVHWLLYYYPFYKYKDEYSIPKTSANTLTTFFTYHVPKFYFYFYFLIVFDKYTLVCFFFKNVFKLFELSCKKNIYFGNN